MNFKGYHHIGLMVKDLEKSLDFYTKGLGGQELMHFSVEDILRPLYMIDLGDNAVVELIPCGVSDAEANARWAHIALRSDNAKAAYASALKAGAAPHTEPKDLMIGDMPACIAFVTGPDGEVIEFFEVKQ